MRNIFFILIIVVVWCGCGKEEKHSPKTGKRIIRSPRQGVWRALKLMEASLNHRNYQGYLRVFGGAAAYEIRKQLTEKKFLGSVRGRYKLGKFYILKRHSKAVVTVKYQLRQRIKGAKETVIRGSGLFSAAPGLQHWVILSFK